MFQKSEIKYFVIAVLVMAFALAFNDGSEVFEWAYWLNNFIMTTLIVGFSFLIHQVAHKLAAQHHGFETEFKLWGIKNLKFSSKVSAFDIQKVPDKKKPIPNKYPIKNKFSK